MSQLIAEEFVPSTFAERGVAVPFTTPLLSQARLRLDRNGKFEFLLPNFTGGRGVYVMPWKSLPSVMTITLHDRLLFEELEGVQSHTPDSVRTAVLKVQATGVAGPDAAATAAKAIEDEAQYLVLTQFVLVTELLKLVGITAQDLMKPGSTADQAVALARQSLGKVAALVKVSPDDLSNRVERLGTAVAPVGLPQAGQPGRLRTLLTRLEAFEASVTQWAETDVSDVAILARYSGEVARHTVMLARERRGRLDALCGQPKQVIHEEARFMAAIGEQVGKLSWLMDGWDFIIALWEQARLKPLETQQTTLSEISRLVPAVPREESSWSAEGFDPETLEKIQRRWVRMNEDWRTGAFDMDAVMRIETIKAAVG